MTQTKDRSFCYYSIVFQLVVNFFKTN